MLLLFVQWVLLVLALPLSAVVVLLHWMGASRWCMVIAKYALSLSVAVNDTDGEACASSPHWDCEVLLRRVPSAFSVTTLHREMFFYVMNSAAVMTRSDEHLHLRFQSGCDVTIGRRSVAGLSRGTKERPFLTLHAFADGGEHFEISIKGDHDVQYEEWRKWSGLPTETRDIFVLVNPVCGPLGGGIVWESVKHVFDIARECGLINYTVVQSESRESAVELVRTMSDVDALVCVGGDGTLFDAVNALISRYSEAFESEGDVDLDGPRGRIQLPLGVIPAGSGNGLAASISLQSPVQAACAIVHGKTSGLDTIELTLGPDRKLNAFLQVSIGIMSDVDFDTEPFRWMGDLRFLLYAMYCCLFPNLYGMRASLSPHMQAVTYDGAPPTSAHAISKGNTFAVMEQRTGRVSFSDPYIVQWIGCLNTLSFAQDFVGAPYAKLDDGYFDVIVLPATTGRFRTMQLLFEMMTGKHIVGQDSHYFKVPRGAQGGVSKSTVKHHVLGKLRCFLSRANAKQTNNMEWELLPIPQKRWKVDVDGELTWHSGPLSMRSRRKTLTLII